MRLVVLLVLCALPVRAFAQTAPPPQDTHRLARWVAILGSTTFDAATSDFDIHYGSHERNPLMRPFTRSAPLLYAVKIGLGAVIAWRFDAVAKKKPQFADAAAFGVATAFTELGVRDLVDGFERQAITAQTQKRKD